MTVWIVEEIVPYEGNTIKGVFSSQEKAEEKAAYLREGEIYLEYSVTPFDVE